jgi:hypothetical protein
MRGPEQGIRLPKFILPSLEHEEGELDRVAVALAPNRQEEFKVEFMKKFYDSPFIELSEDTWNRLENTDSLQIAKGDWETVEEIIKDKRDWKELKNRIEGRGNMYAPIIIQLGETLHLMSGNTRLMVARAAGVTPKVVLVKMKMRN